MRSYSVSYVSNTDIPPSARACCAGAIVESSKESRKKSIGSDETFSRVSRIVDLDKIRTAHHRNNGYTYISPSYIMTAP